MKAESDLLLPRENIERQLRSCEGYKRNNPWWAGRSYRIALTCLSAMDERDEAISRAERAEAACQQAAGVHPSWVLEIGAQRARAEAAEARVRELESQCAAMREALVELREWIEAGTPVDAAIELEEWRSRCTTALSSDAGRALLERVEALERVAEAAMALIGDLPRNAIEYDSLKAELIKRVDALEPQQ